MGYKITKKVHFILSKSYFSFFSGVFLFTCVCTHWTRWEKKNSHILAHYPLWALRRAPETRQKEEMNDLFTFWMCCKICKRQMKSLSKSISLRQQQYVKLLLEVCIKLLYTDHETIFVSLLWARKLLSRCLSCAFYKYEFWEWTDEMLLYEGNRGFWECLSSATTQY